MLTLEECIGSLDEVRFVLGLNEDELSNDISDMTYLPAKVEIALTDIHADLLADFIAAADADTTEAVKLFNIYFVASQLLSSLPGLMPKTISDGKANISRFSASPYEHIAQNVYKGMSEAKTNLASVYGTYKSTTILTTEDSATLIGNAEPTYDPVTGE